MARGEGMLLSFYGDDFTGSTDVMESLEDAGLETVLFLEPPTAQQLAAHPTARAVGVAGVGRTMSPTRMDAELAPILAAIAAIGAPLFHYKLCSTFDSSPTVGSIGRAAELVRAAFGGRAIPLVVGVPQLGRYTAFGTLFATFRGTVHRLDRHPTMTAHPVTPMHEADLLRHLAAQTDLPLGLIDRRALDGPDAEVADRVDAAIAAADGILLLDVDGAATQRQVGLALDRMLRRAIRDAAPVAVLGSSGVEYALGAAWNRTRASDRPPAGAVPQTLVVAGSRAPATEAQVDAALAAGFAHVEADPAAITGEAAADAREAVVGRVLAALDSGRHVLLRVPPPAGGPAVDGTALGTALGAITRTVFDRARVRRLVVAGGDTSGLVAGALGIQALRLVRRLAPGAPLCLATSADPRVDGLEVCLKGGQVGGPDYVVDIAALGGDAAASEIMSEEGSAP